MKQLTCEMCGSTNLLKQGGVFICQDCGTKYSVEDAKKMMVEGTVEVTGTVKVDNTSKLSNLYEIARRSRDDNNTEKAAQYYDMVLQEDPMSWEASFYTTYYSAMQTNIAGIRSAAIKVSNCIDTVLKLIKDNVPEDQQLSAVTEVDLRVAMIASMLCNAAESHYNDISYEIRDKYKQEYIGRLSAARDLMYNMGNQIEKIWEGDEKFGVIAASAWKDGVAKHKKFLGLLGSQKTIDSYSQKIGKYDPKYLEKHDKEASTAKIREIDNRIKSLEKKMSKKSKGVAIFFFIVAAISLYEVFINLEWGISPIMWVSPILLIVCGAVLMKGMTRPEPWRKGLGIAALVCFLVHIILMVAQGRTILGAIASFGWMANWACLLLLPTGIYFVKQKCDEKDFEAYMKQIEDLKKEKADLQKKLEELG